VKPFTQLELTRVNVTISITITIMITILITIAVTATVSIAMAVTITITITITIAVRRVVTGSRGPLAGCYLTGLVEPFGPSRVNVYLFIYLFIYILLLLLTGSREATGLPRSGGSALELRSHAEGSRTRIQGFSIEQEKVS
jgi:hypothetical protein